MDIISVGFAYGLLAGVFKTATDLVLNLLLSSDHFYFQHAYSIINGNMPESWGEIILALAIDFWWTGFLGVIFILIIRKFPSTPPLLRGLFYGTTLWFLFQTIGSFSELPTFYNSELLPLVAGIISDAVYGLVLAYLLHRREQSEKA